MILTALVSTEILAQRLEDPDWVVFDCRHDLADPTRARAEYAASHIPGARFLHLDEDLSAPKTGKNGRHPLPDARVLMDKLGRAGVDSRKQVVAYDAQGGMVAARLWWLLRALGHLPVAVLDGGWNQWIAERRPQTAETPQPQPAQFLGKLSSGWVGADFVRARLYDPSLVLVDASGRFKSPEELEREFGTVLEGSDAQEVVNYCGSGVSACHNLLAMEVAGLRGARLYPGSWSEWCADPSRPVESGEPKVQER